MCVNVHIRAYMETPWLMSWPWLTEVPPEWERRRACAPNNMDRLDRAPKDHLNIRILQSMVSGIPLI